MTMNTEAKPKYYGLVARYDTPEALLKAAEQVRDAGYKRVDALSPFPVHGIVDALGIPKSRMAGLVLTGATVGCLSGFTLQWWLSTLQYPHVTSGRPFFSWPNFIPVIFECTVLFAGLTAFIGMLVRNNLPRPYHPVFAAPSVDDATSSKFMIVVEASDPKFDLARTQSFLKGTGAELVEVAPFEPSGEDQDDGPLMH